MKNNLLLQKVFSLTSNIPKRLKYLHESDCCLCLRQLISLLCSCSMKPIDRSYCLLVANDNQSPVVKKDLYLRSLKFESIFQWIHCKTFNILVSSRNCFSRELSCTSSKLGKIQAFCWDSNLRYVLNVRQMPYCHVNFFSGITYFISVAMTLKTVLPNFFFLKMWIELVCT